MNIWARVIVASGMFIGFAAIIGDAGIDLVVEAMGGITDAKTVVFESIKRWVSLILRMGRSIVDFLLMFSEENTW